MPLLRCWQPPRMPNSPTCRSRVSCLFQRSLAMQFPHHGRDNHGHDEGDPIRFPNLGTSSILIPVNNVAFHLN